MSIKETCNKCGNEVIEDKKLDSSVWNCPNCGLEEYQSVSNSIQEINKEGDLPKHYLNEEQTVLLILSEGTAVVEGNGKIDRYLWFELKEELNIKEYNIIIKENIQLPDDCSSMFKDFEEEVVIDPNIDTSNVTNASSMFSGAIKVNPDTSNWDTSNIEDMSAMFHGTLYANPNTSEWNTSKVKNMDSMFCTADTANPDTSNWDVSKVEGMFMMFSYARNANPNTENWNVSNVLQHDKIFEGSAYTGKVLRWKDLSKGFDSSICEDPRFEIKEIRDSSFSDDKNIAAEEIRSKISVNIRYDGNESLSSRQIKSLLVKEFDSVIGYNCRDTVKFDNIPKHHVEIGDIL